MSDSRPPTERSAAISYIEALLCERIGWDSPVLTTRAMDRAIEQRMDACGLADLSAYQILLQQSAAELQELMEHLRVPETWFFRDQEPFALLGNHARSQWLLSADPVRLLSVPCSTGEEPYSIAITLLEAGLAAERFHIDALDMSKEAMGKAQSATYGKNSFRGDKLDFRDRYFTAPEKDFVLRPQITARVRFACANILDYTFLNEEAPYDVIFCRNLLIYFDRRARDAVFRQLDRLLRPGGLLFVGAAEAGQVPEEQYIPVQHARSFAFRKEARTRPAVVPKAALPTPPALVPPPVPTTPRPKPPAPKPPPVPEPPVEPQESALDHAERLADQGRLEEAATLCQTHLGEFSNDAQAHFLMGLIGQAAGDESQAEQCFSRALYLQPDHYEAIASLALLAERRGDADGAQRLRQRAQRLRQATPESGG